MIIQYLKLKNIPIFNVNINVENITFISYHILIRGYKVA